MTTKPNTSTKPASVDEGEHEPAATAADTAAAVAAAGEPEHDPTPTQAELDAAKLNMSKASAYLTREAKPE